MPATRGSSMRESAPAVPNGGDRTRPTVTRTTRTPAAGLRRPRRCAGCRPAKVAPPNDTGTSSSPSPDLPLLRGWYRGPVRRGAGRPARRRPGPLRGSSGRPSRCRGRARRQIAEQGAVGVVTGVAVATSAGLPRPPDRQSPRGRARCAACSFGSPETRIAVDAVRGCGRAPPYRQGLQWIPDRVEPQARNCQLASQSDAAARAPPADPRAREGQVLATPRSARSWAHVVRTRSCMMTT